LKPIDQHQTEIQQNLQRWRRKPLLRRVYADFYKCILPFIDATRPGMIVELGSGIGNLKEHLPQALSTDLFPNPWIDVVCDAYELPFGDRSVSHLILFDVFHHLEWPGAFFKEARRVLKNGGRVILFEPYISWSSYGVYGVGHHEPVAFRESINIQDDVPRSRHYYAAQGNATRLFFRREAGAWPTGWKLLEARALSSFTYLLSGGFSKPALYPFRLLNAMQAMDQQLSRWPRIFGARCIVVLEPV
jgi:SAM-dependent methyltransferase